MGSAVLEHASATEVLITLRSAGLTLTVEGDRIRVTPREVLTADLRQLIRTHKDALFALLCSENAGRLDPNVPNVLNVPNVPPVGVDSADDSADLVARWEALGRPHVHSPAGVGIHDLPGWLNRNADPERWESVRWSLAIWTKQREGTISRPGPHKDVPSSSDSTK